jgi:hypothetical protein
MLAKLFLGELPENGYNPKLQTEKHAEILEIQQRIWTCLVIVTSLNTAPDTNENLH